MPENSSPAPDDSHQLAESSSHVSSDSQEKFESRTGTELEAIVIQATCGQCWAYPNRKCKPLSGGDELHFARYHRASVKGIITDEELALAETYKGESNYVAWPPASI